MAIVPGQFHASANTSLVVDATTQPNMPTLAGHLAAVANLDPLLLGATAYLDDVFTSRLAGDPG